MINKFFQNQIYIPACLQQLPPDPGIYSYYDLHDRLLYIGKSNCLKKRISSYFTHGTKDTKTQELVKKIHHIRIITVGSDFESLLLEAKLINYYRPKYNIIWKDDKHYIYIEITKEDFSKVLLSRLKEQRTSIFFGPYPSTKIVRDILKYARKLFPFCSQRRSIRHPCFYSHIGLCNPCPGSYNSGNSNDDRKILKNRYRQNISRLKKLLNGEMQVINTLLKNKMQNCAKEKKFEEAILWRNKLQQFKYILTDYHPPENYMFNPYFYDVTVSDELADFKMQLEKTGLFINSLSRIECYDISNISGASAAGSMVVFTYGHPDKKAYRHFRIKTKDTPDDFAMMAEMLKRRFEHQEWPHPDLIIIDGGTPQLNSLIDIRDSYTHIPFIGISKKLEEIVYYINGKYGKKRLPGDAIGQHLLLRIRDEAHRFAHDYHIKLRLKSLYVGSQTYGQNKRHCEESLRRSNPVRDRHATVKRGWDV